MLDDVPGSIVGASRVRETLNGVQFGGEKLLPFLVLEDVLCGWVTWSSGLGRGGGGGG